MDLLPLQGGRLRCNTTHSVNRHGRMLAHRGDVELRSVAPEQGEVNLACLASMLNRYTFDKFYIFYVINSFMVLFEVQSVDTIEAK